MKKNISIIMWFIIINLDIGHAQNLSFQINSISSTKNMIVSSLPFQLENRTNCLSIENGLSIFTPKNATTRIQIDCIVPQKFDHYGLKIYPQPIGNQMKIQLIKPSEPDKLFSIRCFHISGRLVISSSASGLALSSGFTINTTKFVPGYYIFQVISENSVDLIRVIKQD